MYKRKIRKIGNYLGAILPKKILKKLRVKLLTYDPEFEQAITIYKQGSHKYKNALSELGKSS